MQGALTGGREEALVVSKKERHDVVPPPLPGHGGDVHATSQQDLTSSEAEGWSFPPKLSLPATPGAGAWEPPTPTSRRSLLIATSPGTRKPPPVPRPTPMASSTFGRSLEVRWCRRCAAPLEFFFLACNDACSTEFQPATRRSRTLCPLSRCRAPGEVVLSPLPFSRNHPSLCSSEADWCPPHPGKTTRSQPTTSRARLITTTALRPSPFITSVLPPRHELTLGPPRSLGTHLSLHRDNDENRDLITSVPPPHTSRRDRRWSLQSLPVLVWARCLCGSL